MSVPDVATDDENGASSVANVYSERTELIIVCCHAICETLSDPGDEASWRLQPFQRSDSSIGKAGEHETFILHTMAAAIVYCYRPSTLVIFSGGRTTDSRLSEAESYAAVFDSLSVSLCNKVPYSRKRAREDFATDSYQNLLFSILRFHTLVGRYPGTVTVITHAFKERRFLELHAAAIKWPRSTLRVQGINPPFTLEELEQTQRGEHERAYELFAEDPYGVRSPLADKRKARNWNLDVLEGLAVDDEVQQLLNWKGGASGKDIFPGKLPWEDD